MIRATLASIVVIPRSPQSETNRVQGPSSVISNSITMNARGPVLSRQRCDTFPSDFTPVSLHIGFGTMNWKSDSLPPQKLRGFVQQVFTLCPMHKRGLPGNSAFKISAVLGPSLLRSTGDMELRSLSRMRELTTIL